jgi:thiamine-phosphate pyrophosphorylase
MLPELTPAVARALEAAQAWARHRGAADVRPSHLFDGLLDEEEGRAVALVRSSGLDLTAYRKARGERPVPPPDAPPLPLHPLTQTALDRARELALDLSLEAAVGSEAMLIALLRADDDLCRDLVELGLRVTPLEEAIVSLQGPPLQLDEPLRLDDLTERVDTARILDAAANRAREGLRVAEDYCRFVLDDALLTGELKQLRHDLTASLAAWAPERFLEARETRRDVGTALSTSAEDQRGSLIEVAQANLKRVQEAFRSLEEYGKLEGAELGRTLERLRYRAYTLERAVLLGTTARQRLEQVCLYAVLTGSRCSAALDWIITEAAAGGMGMVQLREKGWSDRALLERAREVRRWTRRAGVLFILNDRPDLARLAEADGVHLGQDDLPVKEARRILGPDALIGVSTHNVEQLRRAVLDGASYVGVGPTFPSTTKDFKELAGLEFVRQAAAETSLPTFVIGGINVGTIGQAVAAGARRVAVSQALAQADDPQGVAAELCGLIRAGLVNRGRS